HLFQLFTLIAMEPPSSFAADAIRDRKRDVLLAVPAMSSAEAARIAVRGQYTAGPTDAKRVPDYRAEPEVARASRTATYVALRLAVANWRWAGVPFYLRTGKSMTRRHTEIAIRFKEAPLALFCDTPVEACIPNWLVIRIQPAEGIALTFGAK